MRSEDVKTDGTIRVYVWMIYASGEGELWRFERVVCWEVDVQEENTTYK